MPTVEVIDPDIIEVVDGRIRLIGGHCGACGEIEFPRKQFCRDCGGDEVTAVHLSDQGVLWSWTVQRFPPPSPPYAPAADEFEPFGVGYVELPGEVIVEARLAEVDPARLHIGMTMRLTGIEVATANGEQALAFAFEPVEQGARQ